MKQILFLLAILFAGAGYSQNKPEFIRQETHAKAGPAISKDTFRFSDIKNKQVKKPAYKKDGISPNDSEHLLLANNIAKKIFNKCTDKNHWVIKESKSLASPGQGKIRFERWDNGNANIAIIGPDIDEVTTEQNQISIGSKKTPYPYADAQKYKLIINGEPQTKRNGDTLTVIDKSIGFIVIDGVTYEIVRNIEVRKLEPSGSIITWPHTSVRLYTPNN